MAVSVILAVSARRKSRVNVTAPVVNASSGDHGKVGGHVPLPVEKE